MDAWSSTQGLNVPRPLADLDGVLRDPDLLDASSEDGDGDAAFALPEGLPTDELAQRLAESEAKMLRRIENLKQRKQHLKTRLVAYKKKEKEFVAQMDAHMDEVERNEQELSQRIETLTSENHQLRSYNDKMARDNSENVDKLNETTKQCSESETRVQFLVDRIVALLSAGSADLSQTEAVVNMRIREREMLRQLEETRQQFDEVRQQNGELTSRLTEELGLSRRLSDQLAEVEERFFHHRPGQQPPCADDEPLTLRPSRIGPRPIGLRSDQTEAPPEQQRAERPPLPDVPPPISEAVEASHCFPDVSDAQLEQNLLGDLGRRMPLGAVMEGDLTFQSESDAHENQQALDDTMESGSGHDLSQSIVDENSQSCNAHSSARLADSREHGSRRETPPAGQGAQGFSGGCAASSQGPYPRAHGVDGVLFMEQKLRDALDDASFECAVVRVESGIYNFGPTVRARVELTPENEVVALREDGVYERIDEFIQGIRHGVPGGGPPARGMGPVAEEHGTPGEPTRIPSTGSSGCPADAHLHESFPPGAAGNGGGAVRQELEPQAQGPIAAAPMPVAAPKYTPHAGGYPMAQWFTHTGPMGAGAFAASPTSPPRAAIMGSVTLPLGPMGSAGGAHDVAPPSASSVQGLPKSASSTPERPCVPTVLGMPSQAVVMPNQLISPRPQSAPRPTTGTLLSNQRMLLTASPGAMRMGVVQSPSRQLCAKGTPPQLHYTI